MLTHASIKHTAHAGRIALLAGLIYALAAGGTFNGIMLVGPKIASMILLIAGFTLWQWIRYRHSWMWHRTALDPALIPWGLAFAASLAANPELWRRSAIGLWYVGLYVMCWYALTDALANRWLNRRDLTVAVLLAGTIVMGVGFVQVGLARFDLLQLIFPRPGSTLGNANSLGTALVAVSALSGGLLLDSQAEPRPGLRIWRIIYLVAVLVLLFLTFSRGAWLGLIAAFVLLALWRWGHLPAAGWRAWGMGRALTTRWALMSAAAAATIGGLALSLLILASLGQQGRTFDLRASIYDVALDVWRDQPLTGAGLMTFPRELERAGSMPPDTPHLHAHNIFLHIGAELGLLGVIALTWTAAVMSRAIWRNMRSSGAPVDIPAAAAALAGITVHHLADTTSIMPAIALLTTLTMIIAAEPIDPAPLQSVWRRRGHPVAVVAFGVVWLAAGVFGMMTSIRYQQIISAPITDYRAAAESLDAIIALDPALSVYRSQQALLYGMAANEGDVDAAHLGIEVYRVFVRMEPQSAVGWANLAALYWQTDQREAALYAAQMAVICAPESFQLQMVMGSFLEAMRRDDQARTTYRQILNADTRNYAFWQQTALRRDLIRIVPLSAAAQITNLLMSDERLDSAEAQVLIDNTALLDRASTARYVLAALVMLRVDTPELTQARAWMDQAGLFEATVEDSAWLLLAESQWMLAQDRHAQAEELLTDLRHRYRHDDLDTVDNRHGRTLYGVPVYRAVIRRQFLPQVGYAWQDPILARLILHYTTALEG
jgi:putative inorganic carbon (HCO3(-)) transporter